MIQDTSIYSDILGSIKTVSQLNEFLAEIDILEESLFETTISSESAFKKLGVESASKLKELFLKNNLEITDKEAIKGYLVNLRTALSKFKIIQLTIAFEPSIQIVENIHSWVLENVGNSFILDIETNEALGAGAIIVFNGAYRDLTLKKNIEAAFAQKRNEIMS